MEIINIDENQKEIWDKFIAENNSESFLQSWEWGSFQKNLGRKIWRLGIVNNKKNLESGIWNLENLIVVALVMKHDLPFGRSYFYCPRGPVVNELKVHKVIKLKVLELLFNEIRKIAKKEKSLFLKIDPATEMNYKSGIINQECFINFRKSLNEVQPKDTLILNIEKSEEELLKEMKQKTRYNIRLAKRKGVKIINCELGIDKEKSFRKYFEEFWKLIKETSERDKFNSHNKNYYWQMLENLDGHEGDPPRAGRLRAKLYLAEYKNKIIAANIVLFFGDMAVYLHGASSNEYRNLMAPYLLQWRQIIDAKKTGCKKYDFWGIVPLKATRPGRVAFGMGTNKKNNWDGITRFKKGFGGEEKNYIGAYDLVFSNIGYRIYGFVKFVKSKVIKFIK